MEEKQKSRTKWKQDPQAVQHDILRIARGEFAANGLSGARMDEIASKTKTSKRMLYYYFGDKEGLYRRALEAAYDDVRKGEEALHLEGASPDEGLRRLIEFTFDHHSANPEFIRLVMIENVHNGAYLQESEVIRSLNVSAIAKLEDICKRGIAQNLFRPDTKALYLHWQISAYSFFNVSNRATFALIFSIDLSQMTEQSKLRDLVVDSLLRSVLINNG